MIEGVRGVPKKRKTPPALEPEQIERLLEAATPGLRTWILLAAFAGLRRGEIEALRWEDVDLAVGTLYVQPQKSPDGRTIPLAPRLAEHLAALVEERGGAGGRVATNPQLAATAAVQARELWKRCGFYSKGLPVRHALRHSFCTELSHRGVDIETIKELAGHHSVSITAVYLSTNQRRMRDAVERL